MENTLWIMYINLHQIIINFLIHCAVHAGISKVYIFPFSNYHLSCARNNNNIHTCATSQQNNKLMVFDIHVLMFNFVMQCHVNNHCYGVHACSKHCFQQFALKHKHWKGNYKENLGLSALEIFIY